MDHLKTALLTLPPGEDAADPERERPTEGRLVVVDVTATVVEIVRRHQPTDGVALLLGESAVAVALLSALIKGEERMSLQITTPGPVGRLMAEMTGDGTLRAFPTHAEAVGTGTTVRARAARLLGTTGQFHVMRSLDGRILYQGSSPVAPGGMEASAEAYLLQSEQLPSRVVLSVEVDGDGAMTRARGLLVQALGGGDVDRFRAFLESIPREGARAALVTWGGGPLTSLAGLFPPGTALSPAGDIPLAFACTCSWDRAAGLLIALGADDLDALLKERGEASVDCSFCREVYHFDAKALALMAEAARRTAAPPDGEA